MNRIIFSLVFTAILFLSCSNRVHPLEQRFQNQLDSLYEINKDAIGVLIHIESPDLELSWSSAIGLSDTIAKTELDAEQPALLASNTKPYVAAAILRLVEMDSISLDQSINTLSSKKLNELFSKDGYDMSKITIKHLLSHTSGIADYVDSAYFEFIAENPTYQWKKEEQIQRSLEVGDPLFEVGSEHSYGDINYLLLADIIERKTQQPFYKAIKRLLKFEELGLNHTWFKNLDPYPDKTLPMAHQYSENYSWDSYNLNPSWDLYGGGGIAATVKEAAMFFQYLFEGKIIEDKVLLEKMHQFVLPKEKSIYCLGINNYSFPKFDAYYHGGWWGTDVAYIPEYNSSVAVFTLQKAKRGKFAMLSIDFMKELGAFIK